MKTKSKKSEIQVIMDKLEKIGQKMFSSPVDRGTAIGAAIYTGLEDYNCINASKEMLEQWNYHLAVAALDALTYNSGKYNRVGNKLTITLPDAWENM